MTEKILPTPERIDQQQLAQELMERRPGTKPSN
jgi:hypothetical protein